MALDYQPKLVQMEVRAALASKPCLVELVSQLVRGVAPQMRLIKYLPTQCPTLYLVHQVLMMKLECLVLRKRVLVRWPT